jgi:hypothetical protein
MVEDRTIVTCVALMVACLMTLGVFRAIVACHALTMARDDWESYARALETKMAGMSEDRAGH